MPLSPDNRASRRCLAVVYDKLGEHAEADQVKEWQSSGGDSEAYQSAALYAQRGNTPKPLEWLDTAERVRAQSYLPRRPRLACLGIPLRVIPSI